MARAPHRSPVRLAAAVAIVPILLLAAGEAAALRCDPTDNDINEARRVIRHVQALEDRVSEALRLQTGQISGYVAQAAAGQAEALDGHARARAQTTREAAETRQIIAHRPSRTGCSAITGMAGLDPAAAVARQIAANALVTETARLAGNAEAIGYPAGDDATMRSHHIRRTYPDGRDIRFDSLFDRDNLTGPDERGAALDYTRHLVAPVTDPAPPDTTMTSPGDHRRYLERRARDARAGLAVAWMTRALADRIPAVERAEWAAAVAPGTAPPGAALSSRGLRQILAVRRFDTTYLTGLNELGSEELLREIIRNQSQALRLAAARYDLAEHHGAIAASILAILNEDSRYRPAAGRR